MFGSVGCEDDEEGVGSLDEPDVGESTSMLVGWVGLRLQ